jgi:2-methylisocitrate lyase-like PEP mutase family enzyme
MPNTSLKQRLKAGEKIWAAAAYDALSAKLIDLAGFDCVVTSGFGISASYLAQADVELYTMTENLSVAARVAAAVGKPVISDCDTGYGNVLSLMRTVREFERAGVKGVLLEDQVSPKRCPAVFNEIQILPIETAANRIRAAVAAKSDPEFLIVARTDAPTADEAILRASAYARAGADVVKGTSRALKNRQDLAKFKASASVPVWLGVVAWLEELRRVELEEVGDLIDFGFVPLMSAAHALVTNLGVLVESKDCHDLPLPRLDHRELSRLLGKVEMEAVLARFDS